jgi:putative methionine-R-sulfoxide reductase with GAF domain
MNVVPIFTSMNKYDPDMNIRLDFDSDIFECFSRDEHRYLEMIMKKIDAVGH